MWYASWSKPKFFAAWAVGGWQHIQHFEEATPGTNHYYTVRNVSGTNYWRWYVDGVYKNLQVDLEGFRYGYAMVSSERNSLDETNYSHFWGLRKRDSAGNWYYWSYLPSTPYSDNDPEYDLTKVSNTECKMEK